jgi:hypothetical protein
MCKNFSKTFLSNLNILVFYIFSLNSYKMRYQTNYFVVICDVVPVAAQNHHAYTTHKHTLYFLINYKID